MTAGRIDLTLCLKIATHKYRSVRNNQQVFGMTKGDDLSRYMDKIRISDNDFYRKGTRASKLGVPGSATDKANRATQDQVLDPKTKMILLKMINKGTFDELKACLSTGKEANVYRAVVEEPYQQYAVKVYKTAILAFKDRERYVVGEHRFRFGYSRSNPRKMVKLWAEKETRNLKRIWRTDIPVPKPLHLDNHVLIMEFLGTPEGFNSPRLKDAEIDPERYPYLYLQLLSYMRILYQECRLVHADLSEYNVLFHEDRLWIIDVSQSVEHDHPMSLEFLRMDIKNVNHFFQKRGGVEVFGERQLFIFITQPPLPDDEWPELSETLIKKLEVLPKAEITDTSLSDDAVFRQVYIPRNLNDVFDIDRDVEKVKDGEQSDLIYKDLLQSRHASRDSGAINVNDQDEENGESDDSAESNDDSYDDSSDSSDSEITDVWDDEWEQTKRRHANSSDRKFLDREANKERKKQIKQEKKEQRATKMKKKDKKRLVAASKNSLKSSFRR